MDSNIEPVNLYLGTWISDLIFSRAVLCFQVPEYIHASAEAPIFGEEKNNNQLPPNNFLPKKNTKQPQTQLTTTKHNQTKNPNKTQNPPHPSTHVYHLQENETLEKQVR